ncbi:MAG: hypothetical protein D6719_10170 [Candidatus Dadabacteria bacterium]|nr:MAG: hypothetical protein D6719_10170 [Candidatus Dadabacteria bacterium]
MKKYILTAALLLLWPIAVFSCPQIEGLIDYNCDQQIRCTFTGDSIVKGVGDRLDLGGFVGRLETKFNTVNMINLGVPGITTLGLYRGFLKNLNKAEEGATKKKTKNLDCLVIYVGTNDYWQNKPVKKSIRNIKRLVSYLNTKLAESTGVGPKIFVSTLIKTDRSFQQPFISALNKQIRKAAKHGIFPMLNMDQHYPLNKSDHLHPNPKGYTRMANRFYKYIKGKMKNLQLADRSDNDSDGLYDQVESLLFATDSSKADTDGDGYSDGDEVLTYGTDPADSSSHP